MVKPERLRNRLGTVPFPLGIHNGVEGHTGARYTVDSVVEFDVVSVHGVLRVAYSRVVVSMWIV